MKLRLCYKTIGTIPMMEDMGYFPTDYKRQVVLCILQTARICSDAYGKVPGWRSAVG